VADRTRRGVFARGLKAFRSINWGSGDGYVVESIEYVNPNGPPPGDPFTDPAKVARLLERTRQSILNRPCLCLNQTCERVECPSDGCICPLTPEVPDA
jgi:hypothetical protein